MKLFTSKKKCNHTQNVRHKKYHSEDGTPMIETQCFDCDYTDIGCVYADGEWEDRIIVIRSGKTEIDEALLVKSK